MDERLRELRLQEERTFLRSVAREEAPERPPDQWHSRAPAIFPEPLASDAALCVPNSPKSHRDLSLIAEAVGRSDFLRRLGEGCPEALAQSFTPVWHGPGDTVLAEGTEGTAMYIVAALGPVRLWAIDRQRYRAIATSNAKQRRAEILSSLRTVPWLRELSDSQLCKLLDAMEECSFEPGQVIIREGDEGENFYIILKGEGHGPHCRGCGSPSLRPPPAPLRLEELLPVCYEEGEQQGQRVVLGTGGFGRVELVRCRERLFALKRIRKDWVVRTRQQEHVRTERRVLAGSSSPFVVGRCFEEPLAVFCCACVVEGLEYLHGRGIVYRDLKPENLMLDQRGYVKLVDFGFAKELGRGEKTFSFCGTPEYLAPEVLRQEGHDFAVDFWMLGILTFELLVGRPPFHSADPQQIYSRILDGIFSFPAFLGEAACSLIGKLCRRRPGQRLGNTASGIRGIKKHRWFGALKWRKLSLRQLEAPTLRLVKEGPPYINFKRFSVDWEPAEDEFSGWDEDF
ncbi:hypothetical protein Q9966_015395 [Columba livia]|nr:hypothetical protein Q9966_015395 [Columba livia]